MSEELKELVVQIRLETDNTEELALAAQKIKDGCVDIAEKFGGKFTGLDIEQQDGTRLQVETLRGKPFVRVKEPLVRTV